MRPGMPAAMADQSNESWHKDVLSSFKTYIDLGLTSFVWDVFMAAPTIAESL